MLREGRRLPSNTFNQAKYRKIKIKQYSIRKISFRNYNQELIPTKLMEQIKKIVFNCESVTLPIDS